MIFFAVVVVVVVLIGCLLFTSDSTLLILEELPANETKNKTRLKIRERERERDMIYLYTGVLSMDRICKQVIIFPSSIMCPQAHFRTFPTADSPRRTNLKGNAFICEFAAIF